MPFSGLVKTEEEIGWGIGKRKAFKMLVKKPSKWRYLWVAGHTGWSSGKSWNCGLGHHHHVVASRHVCMGREYRLGKQRTLTKSLSSFKGQRKWAGGAGKGKRCKMGWNICM